MRTQRPQDRGADCQRKDEGRLQCASAKAVSPSRATEPFTKIHPKEMVSVTAILADGLLNIVSPPKIQSRLKGPSNTVIYPTYTAYPHQCL